MEWSKLQSNGSISDLVKKLYLDEIYDNCDIVTSKIVAHYIVTIAISIQKEVCTKSDIDLLGCSFLSAHLGPYSIVLSTNDGGISLNLFSWIYVMVL